MTSDAPRRLQRWGLGAAALALLCAGTWWLTRPSAAAAPKNAAAKGADKRPPVPVVTATARQVDLPEVTGGLGTVQSLHDVVVQTQVEGVLTEVAFKEGQRVKKGELLARIDDRVLAAALAQARAEKAKSEAQLASARVDLVRYTNLAKEEAISQQAIDQQAAAVKQLEAGIAGSDAAIANAEARLSFTRIVSPIDGRVGLRRVDPGNVVQPNTARGLVSVTQLDPISVIVALPQDMLPALQQLLHERPDAPVLALDRPGGALLGKGRLEMIDNEIDRATGTITMKAVFPNAAEKLWPGQSVVVELETGLAHDAIVVPARAVQRGIKGPYVYRVASNKAEVVPVGVGHEHDGQVVITSGLAAGDVVVSDGQSRVTPGATVKTSTRADGRPALAQKGIGP